jgi:hypothetical protein
MQQQRHPINSKIFTAYNVFRELVNSTKTTTNSKISYIKKSDLRQKFLVHFVEINDLQPKFSTASFSRFRSERFRRHRKRNSSTSTAPFVAACCSDSD